MQERRVTLRLLAVHAHPDDESSKGAATAAHYRSLGARVLVVSCTGGERGSVLNPALAARTRAERDMAGLRRREMAAARDVLGVEHAWLGYADSGLPAEGETVPRGSFADLPVETPTRPLVRIVRAFRPHVVVAYDENGGYPHPDHIRAHEIAVRAFDEAGDPAAHPGTGDPWTPAKLYYDRIINAERARAVHEAMRALDPPHPLTATLERVSGFLGERAGRITTRVPCGDSFEARDAALRCHASQVAPDEPFFFWPNDLQRRVWPTEDFELVRSRVPVEAAEDDLFAGVVDEEAA
jgi:mycothiol S-conjugate amidase